MSTRATEQECPAPWTTSLAKVIGLRVLSLAGIGLVALTSVSCSEPPAPLEPQLRPVRSIEVQPPGGGASWTVAGVAKAGLDSNLSFRVSGNIESLPVQVGDRVSRGDLLGRLDPADLELQVEQSQAALAQVAASLRRSEADYERTRGLYENNNASKSDLDAARAGAESARAQFDASGKALAQARRQLDYSELRAPVAGDIAAVDADLNEAIQAGQTVVRLTSGSRPEVEVAVSEITIPYLRVGMVAEVYVDAFPGRTYQGSVTELGVATSQGTSTYPVVVRLEQEASLDVRSGMSADVVFKADAVATAGAVRVPSVSVGEDRDGRFVYVLEEHADGTATVRRRAVILGEFVVDGVEIESGLEAGERVVTAGVRRLVDGMKVTVVSEAS